ncbi:MAG: CARDB domain-containing protein [Phycisphaerae bacterium]
MDAVCAISILFIGCSTFAANAQTAVEPGGQLTYRPDSAISAVCDVVTLTDGTLLVGKALEWGAELLVLDAGGNARRLRRGEVRAVEHRANEAWHRKPANPDLTVAYVERLPRDPSWHEHVSYVAEGKIGLPVLNVEFDRDSWHPAPGAEVRFVVHIKNAGGAPAAPFAYRVCVDDREIKSGRTKTRLPSDAETTVGVKWSWQPGRHDLRVELDTEQAVDEISEWNNTFIDPVQALGVFVCVPRSVIEAFAARRNMVDTFCFEDWAQFHVRTLNRLFAESTYPSAPDGIKERVRIDRILIVDGNGGPKALKSCDAKRRKNGEAGAVIEFGATWRIPTADDAFNSAKPAGRVDWVALKHIVLQLGLVDLKRYDSHPQQCLVRDAAGDFVERGRLAGGPPNLMYEPGPYRLGEADAAYLNQTLGRPRGVRGDGQWMLPEHCVLEVRGNDGRALADVRVELFQRMDDGPHGGFIAAEPFAVGQTDAGGQFALPNRPAPALDTPAGFALKPNPFGRLDADGIRGLVLVRLRHRQSEQFHFICVEDFNRAYARGCTDRYVHPLTTRFAPRGAPPPIDRTRIFIEDDLQPNHVSFRWAHWAHSGGKKPMEYRVYQRNGMGGDEHPGWRRTALVKPNDRGPLLQPHRNVIRLFTDGLVGTVNAPGTWLAATRVGADGLESALSEPLFMPVLERPLALAVTREALVYVSVDGHPTTSLFACNLKQPGPPFLPMGLRVTRPEFAGYVPDAAGIALDADGRLLVADAANNRVAWYERGALTRLLPAPSGDAGQTPFSQPSDVAVDQAGRVYVADTGNHRVVVFDRNAKFLHALGKKGSKDGEFDRPSALGYANGFLAVTDSGNERVQVFNVSGERPVFVRARGDLREPGRALVGASEHLYVCCRESSGRKSILVYSPGGAEPQRILRTTSAGVMDEPVGLFTNGDGRAYVISAYPHEIGFFALE